MSATDESDADDEMSTADESDADDGVSTTNDSDFATESPALPHWKAGPLTELDIGLADQWKVILPRVFRYLDQEFIDGFFEHGHLRLSSFARFSTHADEERRDDEGPSLNVGVYSPTTDPDDARSVVTVSSAGANSYVLSGSVIESAQLHEAFGAGGYFVIQNPIGFANAVRRHIPGCTGGLQGHCIYSPRGRVIHRDLEENPTDLLNHAKNPDGTIDMGVLPHLDALSTGTERFLLKAAQFSHQAEYRFVWMTQGRADDYLDIVCPEAREFCKRVTS